MEAKCVLKVDKKILEQLVNLTGVKKEIFQNVLTKCEEKHNGYILLSIGTPKKSRSLSQNNKYWALCTEFGIAMGGLSAEEVHTGVKDRAVAERGYPTEINPISHYSKPLSSAKASVEDFNILIDVLYQIAAEEGYIFKNDI